MPRLEGLNGSLILLGDIVDEPENFVARVEDVLEEAARGGAILAEVRFGGASNPILRGDFMALFREAERRVQAVYPRLRASFTSRERREAMLC